MGGGGGGAFVVEIGEAGAICGGGGEGLFILLPFDRIEEGAVPVLGDAVVGGVKEMGSDPVSGVSEKGFGEAPLPALGRRGNILHDEASGPDQSDDNGSEDHQIVFGAVLEQMP